VALLAEKVRGLKNCEVNILRAATLSAAQLTYSLRGAHSDFVVFSFVKPEDEEVFCQSLHW
jgi:hypothetical protein